MRRARLWNDGSRRLTILFLAVVVPPAVALVWLGLELLDQDRALSVQRAAERRQAVVQAAARSLEQALTDAQRWLTDDPIPPGAARFTVSSLGVRAHPPDRVLWAPRAPTLVPAATEDFAEAERAEFQGGAARALHTYEKLTRSSSPAVRAGATLRVARVLRREKRWDEAIDTYQALASVDDIAIDDVPASLAARRAICFVLAEAGRSPELVKEAASLERDLLAGRWMLDRITWDLTAGQIAQWTGRAVAASDEARTLSATAAVFWREWQRNDGESSWASGRRVIVADRLPVTLLVRATDTETTALAILPALVDTWLARAATGVEHDGPLTVLTESGDLIAGPALEAGGTPTRSSASESGLPWTVALGTPAAPAPLDELAPRRRLLMSGLAAIVLLLAGGSAVLWRAVQQQLAVARLQTSFVAAVSHEFRTPLASLRHVTELLDERDDLPREERQSFYGVLTRNTERLHRLVESLLDFARMESGRKPYDARTVSAGDLVRQIVTDFERDGRTAGVQVEVETGAPGATDVAVRADRAAIGHALWNLLDNAVKYSPGQAAVHVAIERHPAGVAIAVSDKGIGIPRREQREIFDRFVRGEQAQRLGIKGTGLGLAMVSHIADAHGGTVEVESTEGLGSTFRLILPEARSL
jgi:signal transduction histidine kinase